jgi:diguanylate cyclase (GGDEF)-like protein/PAS domain S-box-containing protein
MLRRFTGFNRFQWRSARAALDQALAVFSIYLIPLVIAALSAVSLFGWDSLYSSEPLTQLDLRVLQNDDKAMPLPEAREKLAKTPAVRQFETRLSERPVWFGVQIPPHSVTNTVVEFPSRHVVEAVCWDAATLVELGTMGAEDPTGNLSRNKTGVSLRISSETQNVMCRASFQGPARLTAMFWTEEQFDISAQDFHRKSGLLDGGMMVLAIFVFVTALITRQKIYIVFAAWLVFSLRVSATSGGWDVQWLNHEVPNEWLPLGRSVTRALWALLTVTLFKGLFHEDLKKNRYAVLINIAEMLCVALLIAAFVMPRSLYLQTMWVTGTTALLLAMVTLISLVFQTRSRVALWYAASLAITMLSGLSEILAVGYNIKFLVGALNTVTAALASSLLAALAIAEQMHEEHKQRLAAQAAYQSTFEAMPIGLFTLDLYGRFVSANPALTSMLGAKVLSHTKDTWQDYFGQDAWLRLHHMVHDNRDNQNEIELASETLPGAAQGKRFLVQATLARDKIEGSLQDVTEKSRATEELRFLANHDSLTKVLNRRGIGKELSHAIDRMSRGESLALAYLDLDRFKLINDLYGHSAGDDVLQQICNRVTSILSPNVQFGRVGGDEFIFVMQGVPIAMASLMCRGIIDIIGAQPYRVGESAFHVRGSIGLAELSASMQFNDAISAADRACRQAKTSNTAGLVVYEKDAVAFEQHEAELKLMALLSTSEASAGLYLEMQPIMSLAAPHESLNFEVLLRMRDQQGQVVRTDQLVAAGETSGRMAMIDRWILNSTLAWIDKHQHQLTRTRFVCMNLSGASLNDEEFLQDVFASLEKYRPVVGKLCLEITESVALHDVNNTRRFVERVRSFGAKVALDDFGAGYTSFSYLREFTADLLKIDGSFIVDMNQHPANIAIVEAIVTLAKNLGMKVIAEWAEDLATVQTLAEIGVDYVQGFAVARPQHPDQILAAPSAASFIQDEALARFIELIGKPDQLFAQVDWLADGRSSKVH